MKFPKINSIHFGGKMIGLSILIGAIVPGFLWMITSRFMWIFSVIGGAIFLVFAIIFAIEMKQDSDKSPYYEKNLKETIPFNPDIQYAVVKTSICTGEKVAGFRTKGSPEFTEVMLIRSDADLQRFKSIYDIEIVKTEY